MTRIPHITRVKLRFGYQGDDLSLAEVVLTYHDGRLNDRAKQWLRSIFEREDLNTPPNTMTLVVNDMFISACHLCIRCGNDLKPFPKKDTELCDACQTQGSKIVS